jgi:hypothetical protein
MSSSSPPSNIGGVDLESVLNVGRRRLSSIGGTSSPYQQQRYADTIYLKREDHSNSLLSIDSKIVLFGELQFLCSIFERVTSNIIVYEESIESNSNKTSFSTTFEEEEEEEGNDTQAIASKLRQTSVSSQSSSPPKVSDSPPRRKKLSSIGRSQTVGSTVSDYSIQNLEGKRYGCIQLPNMKIIEILEILLRTGLDLVDESSVYDQENVLHQNFIFTQIRSTSQRLGQSFNSRTPSFIGT